MVHLAVGVLNPKSKRYLVKVKRAGKARPKRPHRNYQTSTYLTAAEYAALERAAAAQQRTVAGLVRAIVLGFLGQEKAAVGPQRPPGEPAALLRSSNDAGDPTTARPRWLATGGPGAKGCCGTPCTQIPKGGGPALDSEGIGQGIGGLEDAAGKATQETAGEAGPQGFRRCLLLLGDWPGRRGGRPILAEVAWLLGMQKSTMGQWIAEFGRWDK